MTLEPRRGYQGTNLVDILDRILDKGLVVAGDVRISLANVELLTIRIRLLVCSIDKAEQIGLNWWRYDPRLTGVVAPPYATAGDGIENRLARIERRLDALAAPGQSANPHPPRTGAEPSSSAE